MRNLVVVLVIIGLVFSFAAQVRADGPVKKLGRGVANVVTTPRAFTDGVGKAKKEGGIWAGLTWGLFKGTVNVVKRTVVGVYEVATFPVPIPGSYKPILKNPEFYGEGFLDESRRITKYDDRYK